MALVPVPVPVCGDAFTSRRVSRGTSHTACAARRRAAARYFGLLGKAAQQTERKRQYWSELPSGGRVAWSSAAAQQGGMLDMGAGSVDWQSLVQATNRHEILEFQTLVAHKFTLDKATRVSVQCAGMPSFWVDPADQGQRPIGPFAGHPYAQPAQAAPAQALLLEAGAYVVRARVRAKYQGRAGCNLWGSPFTAGKPAAIAASAKPGLAPDWVAGEGPLGGTALVSCTICSASRARVSFQLAHPASWELRPGHAGSQPATIEAGQCSSYSIVLAPKAPSSLASCPSSLKLHAVLEAGTGTRATPAKKTKRKKLKVEFGEVRCRKRGSSVLFTYHDFDGSVQHAAVVHPAVAAGAARRAPCLATAALHDSLGAPPRSFAGRCTRGQMVPLLLFPPIANTPMRRRGGGVVCVVCVYMCVCVCVGGGGGGGWG